MTRSKVVRHIIEIGSNTIILSKKEYAFYQILKEKNGELVLLEKMKADLDCDLNYMRLIKKSLQEKINGYAVIDSVYGVGYRLVLTKTT